MTEEQRQRLQRILEEPDPSLPMEMDDEAVEDVAPVPLEPELEARLVAAVLRSGAAKAADAPPPDAPLSDAPPPDAPPGPGSTTSAVDRTTVRRRRWWRAALPLAAAAAFLLFLLPRSRDLPAYDFKVTGSDPALGAAAETQVVHLRPGDSLRIELRPEQAVSGDVMAKAYLRQSGRLVPLPIKFDHLPKGLLRFNQPVERLPQLVAGEQELIVVVGHPAHLPADAEVKTALERGASGTAPGWQLHRKPIVVDAR